MIRYYLALAVLVLLVPSVRAVDFSAGVAAGDVTENSVSLWTRADAQGDLLLEVASDDSFSKVSYSETLSALPASDLTVKVAAGSLQPATDYSYRFSRVDSPATVSRVGHFRTAPPSNLAVGMRFIFTGDSNFVYSPFVAMRHAAAENADLFLWFGDTIYADVPSGGLGVASALDDYRNKYKQIRSDPYTRDLLAQMATWTGWDDHEVRNDYAGLDPDLDPTQRRVAYQAFFEYMPIQAQAIIDDPFRTYRRFRYGANAEFFMLDARQYREPSAKTACGSNPDPLGFLLGPLSANTACQATLSAPRTMLGRAQFDWLTQGLRASTAPVKFVVNNVPLTYIGLFPYDRWDGYDAERRELLEFIDANQITGVVFLTTDTHANSYNPDLGEYFRKHRPDYQLNNGIPMAELIVGPIGTDTLHKELISYGASLVGLSGNPLAEFGLNLASQQIIARLRQLNQLAFIEPNRISYAVFEVSPDARVNVTYRGMPPETATNPDAGIDTLYSSQVIPPPTSPPVPCFLPCLLAGAGLWCVRGLLGDANRERHRPINP